MPGADVKVAVADLARLSDVHAVADTLLAGTERLDVLVHNAGALMNRYEQTVDGLETTTQVQVVAPFLLTSLLFPRLRATPGSRVITVSSGGMYTQRLDVDALTPDPALVQRREPPTPAPSAPRSSSPRSGHGAPAAAVSRSTSPTPGGWTPRACAPRCPGSPG